MKKLILIATAITLAITLGSTALAGAAYACGGHHGGGHHRETWACQFADADGDGVCDYCTQEHDGACYGYGGHRGGCWGRC